MKLKKSDLVIVSQNSCLPTHQRFLFEAIKASLSAEIISTQSYFFSLGMHHSPLVKPKQKEFRPALVLHRTMGVNFDEFDLRLSRSLEKQGARISNPIQLLMKCRDKTAQLMELENLNLPIIPTFSFRGGLSGEVKKNLDRFVQKINSKSYILKTERGNQGKGVNLIHGKQSLYSWLDTLFAMGDQRFLLQPYLEKAAEYRVLMVGNQSLGAISKEKTSTAYEFKANASSSKFIFRPKISNKMLEMSKQIQMELQSDFLAVDFLVVKNQIWVLEIGLCPGFIEFEKASKVNVAKKVLDYLRK